MTSVSGSVISTTYTYDLNGNQTAGLGRTITWTSYNQPETITQGAHSASFLHDMDHQRIKQVATDGTTLYVRAFGVLAELNAPGTSGARWADYLAVGNVKAGVRFTEVVAQTVSTRYYHTDHLGSIAVITDEGGAVVERLSFDAWGKRRYPNGADDPAGAIESLTTRGFTGHETLDSVGLVHMNGRVYDPLLARMISADPTIPDALNAQAWNRYSYVGNDPLTFTDPNGYSWLSEIFSGVATFFKSILKNPIVRAIAQIVVNVVLNVALPGLGFVATAALGTAIVTGLSGGNLGQMLKAGAIAGATALAFFGVGEATGHTPAFGTTKYFANVAGHAGVGCLSTAASGGNCGEGALSAAVGAAAGPLVGTVFKDPRNNVGDFIGGTAATAAIGGLASVAGGGKFENGAVTAAFGYMYNQAKGGPSYDPNMACVNDGKTCIFPVLVLNPIAWARTAVTAAVRAYRSTNYDTSITGPRSVRNVDTNVTPEEFIQNLTDSGYTSTPTQRGTVELSNGENRYVVRPSGSGSPTADFYPNGAPNSTLKLRLDGP